MSKRKQNTTSSAPRKHTNHRLRASADELWCSGDSTNQIIKLQRWWRKCIRAIPCNQNDPISFEPLNQSVFKRFKIVRKLGEKSFVYQYEPDTLFLYMKSISNPIEPMARFTLLLPELKRLDKLVSPDLLKIHSGSIDLLNDDAVKTRTRISERERILSNVESTITDYLIYMFANFEYSVQKAKEMSVDVATIELMQRSRDADFIDSRSVFEHLQRDVNYFKSIDPERLHCFFSMKQKELYNDTSRQEKQTTPVTIYSTIIMHNLICMYTSHNE